MYSTIHGHNFYTGSEGAEGLERQIGKQRKEKAAHTGRRILVGTQGRVAKEVMLLKVESGLIVHAVKILHSFEVRIASLAVSF